MYVYWKYRVLNAIDVLRLWLLQGGRKELKFYPLCREDLQEEGISEAQVRDVFFHGEHVDQSWNLGSHYMAKQYDGYELLLNYCQPTPRLCVVLFVWKLDWLKPKVYPGTRVSS